MLLASLLSYAGFSALCLSRDRHHSEVFAGKPGVLRRLALRLGGWLLLGLSLPAAILASGWSFGLVEWTAGLMASASLLVWLLPYRPRAAVGLAALGLLACPWAVLS